MGSHFLFSKLNAIVELGGGHTASFSIEYMSGMFARTYSIYRYEGKFKSVDDTETFKHVYLSRDLALELSKCIEDHIDEKKNGFFEYGTTTFIITRGGVISRQDNGGNFDWNKNKK
jgi:hypothetical protein